MLIGRMPEIEELKEVCSDIRKFKRYSSSLIPKRFKDITEIESNQLYICASMLLRTDVHYEIKGKIAEECMSDIYVNGCLQNIVELSVVMQIVNIKVLDKYIKQLRMERMQNEYSLYT